MILSYKKPEYGTQECSLNTNNLFDSTQQKDKFNELWPKFFQSDETHKDIFFRDKLGHINYLSESFIPSRTDNRPPVLLVFGNPASQSIHHKMCFAYEGNYREHRFWVALRKTGLLKYHSDENENNYDWETRNQNRKKELFNLEYDSPFRLGISMFYSMPSPASKPHWSGVDGLLKLFGKKAMDKLNEEENQRINKIINSFMLGEIGAILTFQKNAYEEMRSGSSPGYKYASAKKGVLIGKYKFNDGIPLVGLPPTRLFHSKEIQRTLKTTKTYLQF